MTDQADALTVAMPPDEILHRLQSRVAPDGMAGAMFGDRAHQAYVGSFNGRAFRIRSGRPMPQFYATYLFGRIEEKDGGSVITFRFGHRPSATWALWILRIVGAFLVSGALLAALQQLVFFFGAVFVAVGMGLLLWAYRLRADDKERLRSFVVTATSSAGA